jgi:hypothetical protein
VFGPTNLIDAIWQSSATRTSTLTYFDCLYCLRFHGAFATATQTRKGGVIEYGVFFAPKMMIHPMVTSSVPETSQSNVSSNVISTDTSWGRVRESN